jgi:hypothetical protein
LAVADLNTALPFLDDASYQHFLDRHSGSVQRAALDAAKTILFLLAQRTNKTVDTLSISGGSKAAEQYRLALQLFLRDPYLNPVLSNAGAWAGGVSVSDMQTNNATLDNNYVRKPAEGNSVYPPKAVPSDNPYWVA